MLQIIRYRPGEHYSTHHDQAAAPRSPQGARLYTFFMYLTTPEEGGSTYFGDIDLRVNATKGSALLWPSLMDQDVSLPELRAHHEALPVVRGTKVAATAWVHMFDYRRLWDASCDVVYEKSYRPHARIPDYLRARRRAGLDASLPLTLQENPLAGSWRLFFYRWLLETYIY